jgi:hypothetical protein
MALLPQFNLKIHQDGPIMMVDDGTMVRLAGEIKNVPI